MSASSASIGFTATADSAVESKSYALFQCTVRQHKAYDIRTLKYNFEAEHFCCGKCDAWNKVMVELVYQSFDVPMMPSGADELQYQEDTPMVHDANGVEDVLLDARICSSRFHRLVTSLTKLPSRPPASHWNRTTNVDIAAAYIGDEIHEYIANLASAAANGAAQE